MSLKRKHNGSLATLSQPLKKSKVIQDHESDQEISDDGMDTANIAGGRFDESATSEESGDDGSDAEDSDEDQVDGDAGEANHSKGHGGRTHPSPSKTTAFRAPTTQEIRMMKEASDLFRSNSFKLQVLLRSLSSATAH
ncbi:hypothetical protein M407DRAFT_32544 [Tulasnella calospora MUT 4182]|uniref:Uncharacterized protein n=1 Tax=Tulasnella calospora MUT 4182 TaxID=1051891 RepID=A0A0C3L8C2_9AGAM|nr:hypothetical protein M407DRAFT_32544 [Tulasnella calospora MUT 4182]